MQLLRQCQITPEQGLEGDFRGKPGSRQVSVLSEESWQAACDELGIELGWHERRANLLISGYEFSNEDIGRRLQIGDAILRISRETMPCRRMEEVCSGLSRALIPRWRGGVCCRVIQGGMVKAGDIVTLLDASSLSDA